MTNSGSNSEGSGPFPVGAALLLSPSLDLDVRLDGDKLRELERLGVELDREGVDCGVVRCFACSSAIRASMAPRMRCGVHVSLGWVTCSHRDYLESLKHDEGRQTMKEGQKN
jgi:hypothetical protein